jgi:hypothetical protein
MCRRSQIDGIAARGLLLHDHADRYVNTEAAMFTLTIEHAISDFPTWKQAFDRFAEARENAGVRSHRICRPVGDPHYLVIELDFDAQQNADSFRQFLQNVVWANRDASPALASAPETRILETCWPPAEAS